MLRSRLSIKTSIKKKSWRTLTTIIFVTLFNCVYAGDTVFVCGKPHIKIINDSLVHVSGTIISNYSSPGILLNPGSIYLENVPSKKEDSSEWEDIPSSRFLFYLIFEDDSIRNSFSNSFKSINYFGRSFSAIEYSLDKTKDTLIEELNNVSHDTVIRFIIFVSGKRSSKIHDLFENVIQRSVKDFLIGLFYTQKIPKDNLLHCCHGNIVFTDDIQNINKVFHDIINSVKMYKYTFSFDPLRFSDQTKKDSVRFTFKACNRIYTWEVDYLPIAKIDNKKKAITSITSVNPSRTAKHVGVSSIHDTIRFYLSKGYPWKGLQTGINICKTTNDKTEKTYIHHIADSILSDNFQNNGMDSIYAFYKKAKQDNYFSLNFTNHYILARCCEQFTDEENAYENYKWLVFNWTDAQKFITWKEALIHLRDYQFLTFRFVEATSLNERLFNEFGDVKAISYALAGDRLKYIAPIADIMTLFLQKKMAPDLLRTTLGNNHLIIAPEYIESIYISNSDQKVSHIIYQKPGSQFFPRFSISSRKAQIDKGRVYVTKQINKNECLVIQCDLNIGRNESTINIEVVCLKQLGSAWRDNKEQNFSSGTRYISQVAAEVLKLELENKMNGRIEPYFTLLKSYGWIKYISTHDQEGNILQNDGFERTQSDLSDLDYKRSSTSMVLYIQSFNYKKYEILDIVNPVFLDSKWIVGLRMGFKK
jgi:hypothetical protein